VVDALIDALDDDDALVRAASIESLAGYPLSEQASSALVERLADPVRLVRVEAAIALAGVPGLALSEDERRMRGAAVAEYRDQEFASAERPEALANLATLEERLGRLAEAEAYLRRAFELDPRFVPAYANLADLYRAQERESEAAEVISRGLEHVPDAASLRHAFGLLHVRGGRVEEAVSELRRATELAPGESRYAYVYAVALRTAGERRAAVDVLEEALEQAPTDRDILEALISYEAEDGRPGNALDYAKRLLALSPNDPSRRSLVEQLASAAGR